VSRTEHRNGEFDNINNLNGYNDGRERRDWSPEGNRADREDIRDRNSLVNRLDSYGASNSDERIAGRDVNRGGNGREQGFQQNEYRRDQSQGRENFGNAGSRRDEAEDNWTGRSRGEEFRQEDFESLPRQRSQGSWNQAAPGRDRESELRAYGRQQRDDRSDRAYGFDAGRSESRYQVPGRADNSGYTGQGFEDRSQFSPMGRYGQDFGQQSFQGYGFGQESARSLAGVGPRNYKRSDERIKEDLCELISANPWLDASNTDVEVKGGVVTLSGTVQDRRDRRVMEDLAEAIPGVREVECLVKVESKRGKDQPSLGQTDGNKLEKAGSMTVGKER